MIDWTIQLHRFQAFTHTANADEFWAWTSIVAFIALAAVFVTFHFLHRARLIENTPTSKIRSAVQGYVELIGKACAYTPMHSPLKQIECVWYLYSIEKKKIIRTNNQTKVQWVLVDSKTSDAPFLLQDDTGQCLVNPSGAEVFSMHHNVWYDGFLINHHRYTEYRIHVGDPLYALGLFTTVNPSDSDAPTTHVISKTGQYRQPFILSSKSPKSMARKFRLYAAIACLVFIVSTVCYIGTVGLRLFA